ncbi:hypothetical protein B0A48_01656 [Cryoendolithus antarcticus]|uniref:Uncharacterized protein n=1 Tax=Cryoendolithus antarcticus TaxID=1507870 RepID=A0A1V8TQA5_9PEZI|nr:hypothetical protein B0A48_01656 [Cryoendolithus antarcticus]
MSAIFKSLTIFSGLAVTGAATYHTVRSGADFSVAALKASEAGIESKAALPKPKLPSELWHFTTKGGFSLGNAA